MQPTYLPWPGYFNLIATVDRFVLLDDVQYERRSWQSRNRILLSGAELYLTVPVRRSPREELIRNIVIDNAQDWRNRHLQSLQRAYGTLPFGRDVVALVEDVFRRGHERLAALNQELVASICRYVGLSTPLAQASDFNCGGKRGDHLAAICHALGCDSYVSPARSREYLEADRFAENSGIALTYQEYTPPGYPQRGAAAFVSHLSVVDVLAHHGSDFARAYILAECRS